jgi:hypothetical protein
MTIDLENTECDVVDFYESVTGDYEHGSETYGCIWGTY